jgi:hypothetical protein
MTWHVQRRKTSTFLTLLSSKQTILWGSTRHLSQARRKIMAKDVNQQQQGASRERGETAYTQLATSFMAYHVCSTRNLSCSSGGVGSGVVEVSG